MEAALLAAAQMALLGGTLMGLLAAVVGTLRAPATAGGPGLDSAVRPTSPPPIAHAGALLGLGFLLAALVVRAVAVGHAPWSNLYEFNQAFAAAALVAYLALERRYPIRGLAPLVALVAAALVAYSLTLPATVRPLPPALQTPLFLTVHVGAAMLAYGIYAIAGTAALAELLQRGAKGRLTWLPMAEVSRAVAHRAVLLGLPVLTLAIVLGALWANLAWRSYWNNDPKELAAAATWLIYLGYLHLAGRRDRWGASAPWVLVLGFGAILFTYLAANLVIPGQHSYSGV
jgi:cytochrome c-type biogenesis protein CcsB